MITIRIAICVMATLFTAFSIIWGKHRDGIVAGIIAVIAWIAFIVVVRWTS